MKTAVMISGSGTILKAMIEQRVPLELVIADRECKGLRYAQEAGIPWVIVDRRNYGYAPGRIWSRERFTAEIATILTTAEIELVAMAGFMTILAYNIFELFGGVILNIHPALLPAFKGEHAVRDTLAAGVTEAGSTIHIATEQLDDERFIVAQERVPVLPGDDVDTLWERIKERERVYYPRILRDIHAGRINLHEIVARNSR